MQHENCIILLTMLNADKDSTRAREETRENVSVEIVASMDLSGRHCESTTDRHSLKGLNGT